MINIQELTLIILFFVIIYFSWKINKLEQKKFEHFEAINEDDITNAVKKVYLADVEAIRLLSNFAILLSQGGAKVPGNVTFLGNVTINNSSNLSNLSDSNNGLQVIGDTNNDIILGQGANSFLVRADGNSLVIAKKKLSTWDLSGGIILDSSGNVTIKKLIVTDSINIVNNANSYKLSHDYNSLKFDYVTNYNSTPVVTPITYMNTYGVYVPDLIIKQEKAIYFNTGNENKIFKLSGDQNNLNISYNNIPVNRIDNIGNLKVAQLNVNDLVISPGYAIYFDYKPDELNKTTFKLSGDKNNLNISYNGTVVNKIDNMGNLKVAQLNVNDLVISPGYGIYFDSGTGSGNDTFKLIGNKNNINIMYGGTVVNTIPNTIPNTTASQISEYKGDTNAGYIVFNNNSTYTISPITKSTTLGASAGKDVCWYINPGYKIIRYNTNNNNTIELSSIDATTSLCSIYYQTPTTNTAMNSYNVYYFNVPVK